jgi:SAM-dependent methyltransferase
LSQPVAPVPDPWLPVDAVGSPERDVLTWLRAERDRPFSGWDFSYLRGRMEEDPTPWNYREIVGEFLPAVGALLDMETGGGEFLASLQPLPRATCATESWPPNLPVARARLEPLGVRVVEAQDGVRLPFDTAAFDLAINRHGSFDPTEVMRVLRPGGRFVTQQVGSENLADLNLLLGAPPPCDCAPDWNLSFARRQLEDAGFRALLAEEAFPPTRFRDAGALVYYLKAVPWQVPDFDVDRYAGPLLFLHRRIETTGPLLVRGHRFLLVAERSVDG